MKFNLDSELYLKVENNVNIIAEINATVLAALVYKIAQMDTHLPRED
jgi:hypothetical protein